MTAPSPSGPLTETEARFVNQVRSALYELAAEWGCTPREALDRVFRHDAEAPADG